MAKHTGSALYLAFVHSGGTIVFSGTAGLYRSFDDGYSVDKADSTAAANTDKEYLPTVRDKTLSWEFLSNGTATPGGTATAAAMRPGSFGSVLWGEMGNSSGQPKGCAYGFVEKFDVSHPYDDVVMVSVGFQRSGPLVFDPAVDTW